MTLHPIQTLSDILMDCKFWSLELRYLFFYDRVDINRFLHDFAHHTDLVRHSHGWSKVLELELGCLVLCFPVVVVFLVFFYYFFLSFCQSTSPVCRIFFSVCTTETPCLAVWFSAVCIACNHCCRFPLKLGLNVHRNRLRFVRDGKRFPLAPALRVKHAFYTAC